MSEYEYWHDSFVWDRKTDDVRRCENNEEWSAAMDDREVAVSRFRFGATKVVVSTVFTVRNICSSPYGGVDLFETMVFVDDRPMRTERDRTPEGARMEHERCRSWAMERGWEKEDDQ